MSRVWRSVKRLYNATLVTRLLVTGAFCTFYAIQGLLSDLTRLRHPLRRYREYKRSRGMSRVHDWIDWLGGYPYEVARPEQVESFCRERGLVLERLRAQEYLFRRA